MDPAITAAIITAATSAVCNIAQIAAQDTNPTGLMIKGVFVNRTRWEFHPRRGCNQPVHGHWDEPPIAVKSVETGLEEMINQGETPEEAAESINTNEEYQKSLYSVFALVDTGKGGESLAVFEIDQAAYGKQLSIACYLKKKKGQKGSSEPYYAGVSISNGNWIKDFANGQGKRLIKHIQTIHTNHCQLSEGETKVVEMKTNNDIHRAIYVTFTAAEQVIFEVDEGLPPLRAIH